MSELRRLAGLLGPARRDLAIGLLLVLLATPLELVHPLVWKHVVDDVLVPADRGPLLPLLLLMVGAHLLGTLFGSLRVVTLSRAGNRVVSELRHRLHRRILAQSPRWVARHGTGELSTRLVSDAEQLSGLGVLLMNTVVPHGLQVVWASAILVWLHPGLAAGTLVPLAGLALVVVAYNRRIEATNARLRDASSRLVGRTQEDLQGITAIRTLGIAEVRSQELVHLQGELAEAQLRSARLSAFFLPGGAMVGFTVNGLVTGAGALLVLQGSLSLGALIAFRGYWWTLVHPLFSLVNAAEYLGRVRTSASRIFAALDEPLDLPSPAVPEPIPPVKGELRLEAVHFGYRPDAPVLSGLDLRVPAGTCLALVGPNGAGKSTVVALLLRLVDPDRGRVTLDGRDLRTVADADLRRTMAAVTQEPFLFDDTIEANLRLARPDATGDELRQALEAAGADRVVAALPDGLATRVGERGARLSGGQRQLVQIARAFLADPRVLLLDEATSAVEPEAEAALVEALSRLAAGRTTVLVSHRMALVQRADRVAVLEGGKVTALGTPGDLATHDGWYARAVRA